MGTILQYVLYLVILAALAIPLGNTSVRSWMEKKCFYQGFFVLWSMASIRSCT